MVLAVPACSPQPPQPPPPDLQMVAVVSTSGTLTPIARYANGTWDIPPWSIPAKLDRLVATSDVDGTWRWPLAHQVWQAPGRDLDMGRPPGTVAAGVPDTWHLFSRTDQGTLLPTLLLHMVSDVCSGEIRWVIATREGKPHGQLPFPIEGVALSRKPSAVHAREDFPDIEQLRDQLDSADAPLPEGPGGRWMETPLRWFGLFTFDDITVGILEIGRRRAYAVLEIEGQAVRLVTEWRRGSC